MGDRHARSILSMGAVLWAAGLGHAGPVWCETSGAGKTVMTAEVPVGVGPIAKIKGKLEGTLVAGLIENGGPGGDFVDVYRIYIHTPSAFTARTVAPMAGGGFNTHLWLFDHLGFGLLANDDSNAAPFSGFASVSNDGSGIMISSPGVYYIAVSGRTHVPFSTGGEIFDINTPLEISGPDGLGGADPLLDWFGPRLIGNYEIDLTGAGFPPCPGDVNHDGVVNIDDLNIILTNWSDGVPPNAFGDLNGDGVVDIDDLNELLANWGSTECFDAGG